MISSDKHVEVDVLSASRSCDHGSRLLGKQIELELEFRNYDEVAN